MSTLEKFFANLSDCGCRESGGAEISATTSDDPFFAKLDRLLAAVPNTSVIPTAKPDQPADDAVAARVREIFSDEKVERELYVQAIAQGLETPYVMFDQPDANKPLLAGNWRITVNVPSVIPGAAVAATFNAATARAYAIEAFRRDPKLTDRFLSFLRTQLPADGMVGAGADGRYFCSASSAASGILDGDGSADDAGHAPTRKEVGRRRRGN